MKKPALGSPVIMLVSAILLGGCGEPRNSAESTTPAASAVKTKLIRMTTPVPPGDDLSKMCQEGMDRFNARVNGAYKMQMFAGGQLASLPESLDAIRTGAIEGGVIPIAAFSGTAPEFGLAELPFLYNNGEANAYAVIRLNDIFSDILQEKADQRSLGCIYVGTLNFLSAKKPIKTLEDLKSMVVGCDTPSSANLIEALNGSGIVVDFSEDYSNLQKGIINAKTSALQYMLMAKLYEVAEYYTVFHGLGSLYSITINSDVYDAMQQSTKDILNKEMSALAQNLSQYYVTLFYDLVDDLEAKGVKFYYLPVAERDKWKNLAYPETIATLKKYNDIGAGIKRIADEANAKYPYVESEKQR
ncbi:MAG: TRAP transporter substrate-binding protein DctP [Acidobacteria bacterium]|nr:TRAP transporter substrate-binding protein DctP [Acidobacteriota bacterium]